MCVIETTCSVATRRLSLRGPHAGDVARLATLGDDLAISRMTLRMPHPFSLRDAQDFVAQVSAQDPKTARTFVIEQKDHGPVGVLGLFEDKDPAPEVGYWIGRTYWGRGYATEALEGALVWARREWGRRALVAGHFADNPASGRVLEKAGFLYTGEVRADFSRARQGLVRTRRMIWLA